ncbi:MAG: WYL domain-containing protein [Bacteroidaceae bacterium]|nr:WYL domain-containing protein [Bacteroidaceae bacterium]
MANVKNGAFREIIIDRCLQNRRGYSTQEIFNHCNDALERRGDMPITALNTIRNDIMSIANRWHVVIEKVRNGREIRYRYEDPNFSIFNSPLNEDEIAQLAESVSLLRRFEGMPGFEWVEEMSAHLETTINAEVKPVIGFDENKQLKGLSFFSPLFKAITSKECIELTYLPYSREQAYTSIVHPYYIKEYNQRWFLFALDDSHVCLTTFAFDRIEAMKKSNKKYLPNKDYDFTHYFNDIVGVSFDPSMSIEDITLWVSREQLPYMLSKPLHKSQCIVEKCKDGGAILKIHVRPNFELEQKILSLGDRVTVLTPNSLRTKILERIRKSIENYK